MDASEQPGQKPLAPIEVSVFTPERAEALTRELALRRRQSRADWVLLFPRRGRVGSVACGVLIAAMHILIVTPLLPASGHPHKVTNAMGSVAGVDVEPAIQVSLIEEPPLALVTPPPTTAVTIQKPELPPLDSPPDLLKSFP